MRGEGKGRVSGGGVFGSFGGVELPGLVAFHK